MISVNEPSLGEVEEQLVADCIQTGWISSSGGYIERFESEWAAICERRFGVAVSNGTVALQLAVAAAQLPSGTEIIMPTFTIVSCALAAIYNNCVPVFVDSDPATWCVDVRLIEERISDRTSAIMPVHIYGHPVDMTPVMDLASKYGLSVIEDAAEAHGALYREDSDSDWRPCGSFGVASTFSFYANKAVTTGEGGMVLTDDQRVAERARSLRNLAFVPQRRFLHHQAGHNFRITNLQAALGVGQLTRFDEIIKKKRAIAAAYLRLLQDEELLALPVEREWARSIYWMFGLVLDDRVPFEADEFASRLLRRGIETRPFFLGMHEQPLFQGGHTSAYSFPVADRLARRGLYLPSGLALKEEQIEYVATSVRQALHE